ncbi:MAG: M50 family metallopeptidase [Terracidiphilus sp.]
MHWMQFRGFFPVFEGFALGVLALGLHEAGHALAAVAVGVRVKGIGLNWKGLYLRREAGTPGRNLVISAAGPMTNLLLVVLWAWWPVFGLANACYVLFNVLPLPGADGERVLRCWLQMLEERAEAKPVARESGEAKEKRRRAS